MADKLLAEWFWTDRWIGSSAFLLPLEARGLYREMLTQAWRRGGFLPNDPEKIMRACGVTMEEWVRCWPLVKRYWKESGDTIHNETQMVVYREATERHRVATERARKAAASRHAQAGAQALLKQCPPSPSPSPDQDSCTRLPLVPGAVHDSGSTVHGTRRRLRSVNGYPSASETAKIKADIRNRLEGR